MYLEGGDQYRGWFPSSLLVGTGLKGASPYRECALNGWVLDGEGKAMHKSLGNAIDPESVIKNSGAEILRLWSASVDFNEDVRMSEVIQTRLVDAYRKLRNTFRYMLGNLSDFKPETDAVAGDELTDLDQWILLRAEDLVVRCRAWYQGFEFHKVYHTVYAFATVDLSSVYFDVLKDRLYTAGTKSKARRSAQTALYRLLDAMVRLLAPIMSFTAEEVWTHMNRAEMRPHGVFSRTGGPDAGNRRGRAETHRRLGPSHGSEGRRPEESGDRAQREVDRRAPGSARAALGGRRSVPLLQQYAAELPGLFIVSQVDVAGGAPGAELGVTVGTGGGTKVRALLEVYERRGRQREIPDHLRIVRQRDRREPACLICA